MELGQLYAHYAKERFNKDILHSGNAFVEYVISGEECLICNIYTLSDFRHNGECRSLIESVSAIAFRAGAKFLSACMQPSLPSTQGSLEAAFKLGFKLIGSSNDAIFLKKVIHG